ncbi:MAG: hypothetical protein Ct9H300mP15_05750 [Gemmatimonadota bacterium]|nr:MAG: hypothetical protein Ct9H300mP15_05750 [Gemmatimonadota bacterium]
MLLKQGSGEGISLSALGIAKLSEDEIRTADIFIESSEAEIHDKARGLGKPLLAGLLDSVLNTGSPRGPIGQQLRGRFRRLLQENSQDIAGDWAEDEAVPPNDMELGSTTISI